METQVFQAWSIKVSGANSQYTINKVKLLRPSVKLTDEEASILNAGVSLHNGSTAEMYFMPEDNNPFLLSKKEGLVLNK